MEVVSKEDLFNHIHDGISSKPINPSNISVNSNGAKNIKSNKLEGALFDLDKALEVVKISIDKMLDKSKDETDKTYAKVNHEHSSYADGLKKLSDDVVGLKQASEKIKEEIRGLDTKYLKAGNYNGIMVAKDGNLKGSNVNVEDISKVGHGHDDLVAEINKLKDEMILIKHENESLKVTVSKISNEMITRLNKLDDKFNGYAKADHEHRVENISNLADYLDADEVQFVESDVAPTNEAKIATLWFVKGKKEVYINLGGKNWQRIVLL